MKSAFTRAYERPYRPFGFGVAAVGLLLLALPLLAQEVDGHGGGVTLLWMVVLLLAAKLSSLVERWGQPAVLGELVIGVVLGNLALAGIGVFEAIKTDAVIRFLAELGVVILLFQIGLETNLARMGRVGLRAFLVAMVGLVLPFVTGTYLVGPWLLPGLSFNAYLFLGATLTATSVGITARVFQDLNALQTREAQIVLGAAVIDDVLGLVILAVVSAIVTAGSVTLGAMLLILGKAVLFLVGAVVVGQLSAPLLGRLLSRVHAGGAMKFTLAISFALTFAYLAGLIGLAPIVGAFAAGLVLDPVHFEDFEEPASARELRTEARELDEPARGRVLALAEHHHHRHVEDLIEPLALLLVPIFFVLTGMGVRLDTLFDLPVLLVALGVTVAAFAGKLLAGLVAGGANKWIVGWGMVPRGEVGLIFATIGRGLGVIDDATFSVVVIMVIATTLIPPPVLAWLIRRQNTAATPEHSATRGEPDKPAAPAP
ncbi:MAG: cation:proton antiporter [Longimicrobiaceae bacterium]